MAFVYLGWMAPGGLWCDAELCKGENSIRGHALPS